MKHLWYIVFSLLLTLCVYSLSYAQWQTVGPYGGWINVLAKDTSGNMYAGTYVGGIFKTSNNGDTWVQIYNDTLIIDPLSVALNSNGDMFVGASPGFLRSTDGGTSWQKINNALNTRTVDELLVLSNGTIIAGNWSPGGMYRSTDNGTTFTTITNGLTNTNIRSLAMNPGNGYLFAATEGGGVFRSTDSGGNWTAVNSGITGTQMTWTGVSPSGDIYATGTSIFRSTNNGDSWTNLLPPFGLGFENELAFSSTAIYSATTGGVYKSTDAGTTWAQESGLPDIDFNRIIASGNTIIAGSAGLGAYRSNGTMSPSDTWTPVVNGMTNTHVVAIDQAPNDDVYAATLLAGVFRSTNAGLTWFSASNGIPPSKRMTGLAVSPTTGTVFASSTGLPLGGHRSTDQGATWTVVNGLENSSIVACNSRGDVFEGVFSTVRRSTNDGVTWTFATLPSVSNIADLAFDGDTVYAATGVGSGGGTSRGVYRSTDNGSTWNPFNNGLSDLNIVSVTVTDTATGPQAGIAAKTTAQPFQCFRVACASYDGGVSYYTPTTDNFPSINTPGGWVPGFIAPGQIQAIRQQLNRLIIITKRELRELIELDCGHDNQINRLSTELSSLETRRLGLIVFLGTFGQGIFRGVLGTVGVDEETEEPKEFVLQQNYPNPFNPVTVIRYQLPVNSYITLKIFDVLGREVTTLVNEIKQPGTYNVTWNADKFSSGIYFYQLRAGNFIETKKLLLLK